jgi:cytochrome c biogenesis protein
LNAGAEALAPEGAGRPTGPASRAWHWFVSIKVGLILLLIITILSFLGMLVPQGGDEAQYVEKYGQAGASLVLALGLDNAYHSWWYQVALLVLAVNITACTIWRMPRAVRTAFRRQWLEPDRIQALALKKSAVVAASPDQTASRVRDALKSGRYSVQERQSGEALLFSATRGGISRLVATIVHIGLVVTLLGGVYGGRSGWSKLVFGAPGETVASPDGTFDVRVDAFKVLTNADGSIKDYISSLTVLEGGREVLKQDVEVNKYLHHRKVNIYQSSYSALPERFASARLRVQWPDGRVSEPFDAPYGEAVEVPGSPMKATVESFAADFRIDTETRRAYSASLEPRNPAIRVNLVEGERDLGGQWVFLNRGGVHPHEGAPQVEFLAYEPLYATGLDFAHNPAVPIVWAGFALMAVGVLPMMVLMTHRRIWVAVMPDGGRARLVAGGAVNKHREIFQREFYRLMDGVESGKEEAGRGGN